jgi:hypothetical protein
MRTVYPKDLSPLLFILYTIFINIKGGFDFHCYNMVQKLVHHLAEISQYFQKAESGKFFWRIKRFECKNFLFEVPGRRIDDCK